MRLPFNETKATQAAARFLGLAGGKLNYVVLIKLLYLADREALLRWGRPITFDEYFSMHKGPVLSQVLSLINEMPEEESTWNQSISEPNRWIVELKRDAGSDELSEAEEELIDETFDSYKEYIDDPFRLVGHLHKILPEWDKEVSKGHRTPLPVSDILKAGKKSNDEIAAIHNELKALLQLQRFVAR